MKKDEELYYYVDVVSATKKKNYGQTSQCKAIEG